MELTVYINDITKEKFQNLVVTQIVTLPSLYVKPVII